MLKCNISLHEREKRSHQQNKPVAVGFFILEVVSFLQNVVREWGWFFSIPDYRFIQPDRELISIRCWYWFLMTYDDDDVDSWYFSCHMADTGIIHMTECKKMFFNKKCLWIKRNSTQTQQYVYHVQYLARISQL